MPDKFSTTNIHDIQKDQTKSLMDLEINNPKLSKSKQAK